MSLIISPARGIHMIQPTNTQLLQVFETMNFDEDPEILVLEVPHDVPQLEDAHILLGIFKVLMR